MQWDYFVSYYLLYSLGGLAILLAVMHMLYRRRSPISMIAWLLLMIIAPYIFLFFYFFFGIRKRSLHKEKAPLAIYSQDDDKDAVHPIETLLCNNGVPASTDDNKLSFYTDATEAYEVLYTALQSAQHSISISTYILKNDTLSRKLFNLLIQKAQAGVDVRILTDAFGSMGIYFWQRPLKRLRQAGVSVSFFMPLFSLPFHNRINLRYHRKIYLVDNEILFSGGMNLAKEYMGPKPLQGHWKDLLFRCEGSMVYDYINIFESDWAYSQELLPKNISAYASDKKGKFKAQVIPSGADVKDDALLEALVYAVHRATQRIWIVTPYFVPDESIFQALRIALNRGVDVKLITPNKSDNLIADLVRSSYIREAQEWGMDIALYTKSMLHAKSILFDDDAVIFGSVNLDNRSLLLNYEVVSIVYSKEPIDDIDRWMKELLKDSTSYIEPANKIVRIIENLMRVFVPQI